MTFLRPGALAPIALAAAFAFAPAFAHAQMSPGAGMGPTMPEYSTDSKNSSGRDLDNLQDKIKGYNGDDADLYKPRSGGFDALSPADQVAGMGAGVNLFEGDDPYFVSKSSRFSDNDIQRIADAGFKTIRVPLFVFAHLSDDQGNPDPYYLKRIDHLVDLATKAHLNIILDEHNYEECATDPDDCSTKLTNVWTALATHYQNAPGNVMFELLNEPNGKLDAATWNAWLPGLVAAVRQTNPDRNIVIGPTMWNSPDQLATLQLPADDHVIVTFHYYSPMEFTHQGASWVPAFTNTSGVRWTGTADEVAAIDATFDKVKAWSTANNKPVFLGEFGSYAKVNPNIDDRAAWTRAVSKAAADRGFARALWVYEGSAGFGIHDKDGNTWVEPLKAALLLQ